MFSPTVLFVLQMLTLVAVCAWMLAGCVLTVRPDAEVPIVRAVFHELRPLYLPAVAAYFVLDVVIEGTAVDGWRIFNAVCQVANWYLNKDKGGDDDRWKRRGERAAEVVSRVGSRLIVVPAQGGA